LLGQLRESSKISGRGGALDQQVRVIGHHAVRNNREPVLGRGSTKLHQRIVDC
jgi:hypothetical protein